MEIDEVVLGDGFEMYNTAWGDGILPTIDEQVNALGLSTLMAARDNESSNGNSAGVSGRLDINVKWGGSEGVTTSAGFSGQAHDRNGNDIKVKAEFNDKGEGQVNLSAGGGLNCRDE